VLLLAACGARVGAGAGAAVPTGSGTIPWTMGEPIAVTGASLAADHRTLTVDAQVPSGPRPCVRNLKAAVTDTVRATVWVQVTFDSPSGDRRSGCTKQTTASARLTLPAPLGSRQLVADHDTVFTADGAKPPALRLCGELGCRPAPTGCTPASYDQALMAVDAPNHTYRGTTDCQGRWLVMDFSWRTGPACGDDTKDAACTSALGDRWFFRAEPSGWVPITSGAAGGCAAVQHREPAFPTAMCASLPPLSAGLHPHHTPPPSSTSP
jgi:hypothetical protein